MEATRGEGRNQFSFRQVKCETDILVEVSTRQLQT